MLERGRNIEHITDYVNAEKEAWDYPYCGRATVEMKDNYLVLSADYPLNEQTIWHVGERTGNLADHQEVLRLVPGLSAGRALASVGRQSYRFSDIDFDATKEGVAIDWPIRYADIAPWYDHVERFAGISGSVRGAGTAARRVSSCRPFR